MNPLLTIGALIFAWWQLGLSYQAWQEALRRAREAQEAALYAEQRFYEEYARQKSMQALIWLGVGTGAGILGAITLIKRR